MKKYNINTIEEFKLNVVGADASVRLRKNQNRNNIRTFEKHKSNAVGVGVPDDPLKKKKHTNKLLSNNQTSNIKHPTSNAAITLIALIITIIVLLILAGVTLNMVMGENGIFGKANNAKNKTELADAKEKFTLLLYEWKMEHSTSNKVLEDFLKEKVEDETIEEYKKIDNENYEIYINGYVGVIDGEGNVVEEMQKAGPRPTIDNIKITLEDGTEVTEHSQKEGTKLKIDFNASIENGEIISIEPSVPYVTDGIELEKVFTIIGKVGENEYTKKYKISVKNKYELLKPEIKLSTQEYTSESVIVDVDWKNEYLNDKKEISIDGGATFKQYTGSFEIDKNIKIIARYTAGELQATNELQVTNIDKLDPKDFTPTVKDRISDTELQIVSNAADSEATNEYGCSGIAKYEYFVYQDGVLVSKSGEVTTAEWNATGLSTGNTYEIEVIAYDNCGNSKKSNPITYQKAKVYSWNVYNLIKNGYYKKVNTGSVQIRTSKIIANYKSKSEPSFDKTTGKWKFGSGIGGGEVFSGNWYASSNDTTSINYCSYASSTTFYIEHYTSEFDGTYEKGEDLLDKVTSNSENAYPENNYQGYYWYEKINN